MDIFGAFQMCSIGILAGPVTVRLSRTYFNDPGRNTIFLWAGIILAGLMSLAVEFWRTNPIQCQVPLNGNGDFPYNERISCPPLDCSKAKSPMRTGPSSDISLIPAPHTITFGTATLLAAGCCVHAIVWMLSILVKLVEKSSRPFGFGVRGQAEGKLDDPIEGTNGATRAGMISVNNIIRFYLSVTVIPVFGGACIALLIMGEINFFSPQVNHQTESLATIGKSAPFLVHLARSDTDCRAMGTYSRIWHCHIWVPLPPTRRRRGSSQGSRLRRQPSALHLLAPPAFRRWP
jgi:hypothetical protein